MKKQILYGIAALMAATTLAGCGTAAQNGKGVDSTAPVSNTPTTSTQRPVARASMLNVKISTLGTIVRDENGNTLYAFANDTKGESTCNDVCATTWPPARKTDINITADGIDVGLIGTTKRKDGTTQLTLNNWPLYRFAADGSGTGSTKGQGSKGVWFVLNAQGKLVKDGVTQAPANASSTQSGTQSGTATGTKNGNAAGQATSPQRAGGSTTTTIVRRNVVASSSNNLPYGGLE